MKNMGSLFIWFVFSFLAGWFGSQFKPGDWYQKLNKPTWTPPSWAFPLAWIILYAMMSIASWMVWERRGENPLVPISLMMFFIQLILNALWSWIFFGRHQIGTGLAEMGGLWVFIVVTIFCFFKVDMAAGFLMIPYLLWVSFAIFLNWSIWKRN